MPKLAYKAALAHAFGRGSNRPARAAALRLACLAAGALGLDIVFAWTANGLVLLPPAHPNMLFFSCAFVMQIIVVVTLLSGAGVLSDDTDSFARLLKTLPLSPAHRSILLLLPTLVLTGFALLLTTGALMVLMRALAVPMPLVLAGSVVGALCGFGLARGLPVCIGVRLGCIAAVTYAEYKLSTILYTQKDIHVGAAVAYGMVLAVLVGLCVHTILRRGNSPPRTRRGTIVRMPWAPPLFWPTKQLLRRRSMLLSLGVGLLLSAGLAVLCMRQNAADPSILGLLGALLAGSFASDIRALARRHRPAEITALRGTLYFVCMQAITAYLGGFIIAAPLLWTLAPTIPVGFITQLIVGISVGLLCGALIVPEARDIMSQFLAVALILALLVGLPQVPITSQLSAHGRAVVDIGVTLICLIGSLGIESKRNNYIWRKTHHA
jgi:hypothetical protein